MMTAHGSKDLEAGALNNQCNGYIEKPFTLQDLLLEIEPATAHAVKEADGKTF